ncbi:SAV_2336 N-terminal domain-related protein [Streptodolium elevatio]
MTIEDALRVLEGAGLPVTGLELLDALWLARSLPRGAASPLAVARTAETGTVSGRGGVGAPDGNDVVGIGEEYAGDVPAARPGVGGPREPRENPTHGWAAVAAAPPASGQGPAGVRLPGIKALPDELAIGRALRPLKRRTPTARHEDLDEAATATASAEARRPSPVLRPARERWMSLALVVDGGVSMMLWGRHCRQIQALMERSGAFRRVQVHEIRYDVSGRPMGLGPPSGNDQRVRRPNELVDAPGRTMVLCLTNGTTTAWRDGTMHNWLTAWGRQGPTAILQLLPRSLRSGAAVTGERWQVSTANTGAANVAWHAADPVLPPGIGTFEGTPIPILEPTPASLAAWSALMTVVRSPVSLRVWSPQPTVDQADPTPPADVTARHFGRVASPAAVRLAAHLAAAAPITVPVMQLVNDCLPGDGDMAPLVEVLLGGLMRPVPASSVAAAPRHRRFDFAPEAKEMLLDSVPTAELVACAELVGERMVQLRGRSADFAAWVAPLESPQEEGAFAHLAPYAMRAFNIDAGAGVGSVPVAPTARSAEPTTIRLTSAAVRADVPVWLPEGTVWWLDRRFRLISRLGSGGMGQVWSAQDTRWHRLVALKLFHDVPRAHNRRLMARDLRVAAAASVSSPHLVSIHESGTGYLQAGDQNDPTTPPPREPAGREVVYMAMELVSGRSLAQISAEERPLPVMRVLRWAGQLCDALLAAHEQGLVHHDIKPANVMVTSRDQLKVVDLGFSRFLRGPERSDRLGLSRRLDGTTFIGTPAYISPEQANSAAVDRRSDLYSFGCLLYELLAGRPPFSGGDLTTLLFRHVHVIPEPPSRYRSDIAPALDHLVLALLAKDPGERPQTAGEVRRIIDAMLSDEPPPSLAAPVPSASDRTEALMFRLAEVPRLLPDRAVARLRDLLREYTAHFGPDHPETLSVRAQLAYYLRESGDLTAGARILLQLVTDYARVLGPRHPDTLQTCLAHARWTAETGNLESAAQLMRDLLPRVTEVLGAEHGSVVQAQAELEAWKRGATRP